MKKIQSDAVMEYRNPFSMPALNLQHDETDEDGHDANEERNRRQDVNPQ